MSDQEINFSKFTSFIRQRIEQSEFSQRELAIKAGYESPNMIAMLKTGRVKLALDRVPAMANALKMDPLELFKMALTQYYNADAIKIFLSMIEAGITPVEREILATARSSAPGLLELDATRREALKKLFS